MEPYYEPTEKKVVSLEYVLRNASWIQRENRLP